VLLQMTCVIVLAWYHCHGVFVVYGHGQGVWGMPSWLAVAGGFMAILECCKAWMLVVPGLFNNNNNSEIL